MRDLATVKCGLGWSSDAETIPSRGLNWQIDPSYFNSSFHILDAIVISAGFIVDVLLHGILEEVASLVVILRLWRFFKIIEEFSVGAEEQMDGLELRIEQLETENTDLKSELKKQKGTIDEEEEVGFETSNERSASASEPSWWRCLKQIRSGV